MRDAAGTRALNLYRLILRSHKAHLPPEMRALGNAYVREEFKRHKSAAGKFLGPFYQEWTAYVAKIATASSEAAIGAPLSDSALSALSDDQKEQLRVLREEVDKQYK